jgi:hypothetical protein
MKEWRNDNKQYEKDYRKQYYYENKEKILEKQNCLCGGIICKNTLNRHLKTKKHQDFIISRSL